MTMGISAAAGIQTLTFLSSRGLQIAPSQPGGLERCLAGRMVPGDIKPAPQRCLIGSQIRVLQGSIQSGRPQSGGDNN